MRKINAKRMAQIMRDMAKIPSRASKVIAKDISAEIQANFDRGTDASRRRWKSLAKSTLARGRHPPPLTDTSAGRNSVIVKAMSGAGIRITVGVLYMIYHQFGGKRGRPPRRSFLPQGNELPTAWAEIIMFRMEELVRRQLARG